VEFHTRVWFAVDKYRANLGISVQLSGCTERARKSIQRNMAGHLNKPVGLDLLLTKELTSICKLLGERMISIKE
jgi:hypothetical protein